MRDAFLGAKETKIDKVAAEARKRKDTFGQDERRRKAEVDALLAANGKRFSAVFRDFDNDPQPVIDEWTHSDMAKSPRATACRQTGAPGLALASCQRSDTRAPIT